MDQLRLPLRGRSSDVSSASKTQRWHSITALHACWLFLGANVSRMGSKASSKEQLLHGSATQPSCELVARQRACKSTDSGCPAGHKKRAAVSARPIGIACCGTVAPVVECCAVYVTPRGEARDGSEGQVAEAPNPRVRGSPLIGTPTRGRARVRVVGRLVGSGTTRPREWHAE